MFKSLACIFTSISIMTIAVNPKNTEQQQEYVVLYYTSSIFGMSIFLSHSRYAIIAHHEKTTHWTIVLINGDHVHFQPLPKWFWVMLSLMLFKLLLMLKFCCHQGMNMWQIKKYIANKNTILRRCLDSIFLWKYLNFIT